MEIIKYYILLCATIASTIFAQSDTSKTNTKDSVKVLNKNGIEDVIYSKSNDSLCFSIKNKTYNLFGQSNVKYQKIELNSDKISLDFNSSTVEAIGKNDSTGKEVNSPKLVDNSEKYDGKKIFYNFKTKRGLISYAANKTAEGNYVGKKVKKVDDKTYFVKDGVFSTCDNIDHPHYNFRSAEMKVIPKDKIFAKWIYLEFEEIPIPLPLPFAVIPNQSGRRSGILIPTYGNYGNAGSSFNDFGYYWAMSDYTDLAMKGDYFTRGGYRAKSNFRYQKRYEFGGSIDLEYSNIKYGSSDDRDYSNMRDYQIYWLHSQTINPSTNFNANLRFMSQDYIKTNVYDYRDALNQNIQSSATLNQSYDNGSSLSLNYQRNQNLTTGNIEEVLPSLNYSMPQIYLFKNKNTNTMNPKWYEQITFSYSGQFINNRNKENGITEIHGGIQHNPKINITPKFGYFSVTPYFDYQEKWYNKCVEYVTEKNSKNKDTLILKEKHEYNAIRTYSLGISANTKIYGTANIDAMGIEAFRHTFVPTISYGYTPDFSKSKWGYYGRYRDTSGNVVVYDKFMKEVFRGASSGEQQNVNFSISNVYEIKTKKDIKDTNSKQEKYTLLNWSASTGYNFVAKEFNWSDLNLNYRTQLGKFDFSGSNVFTFYDEVGKQRINKLLWNTKKQFFRMTNFTFSASTRLVGAKSEDKNSKKDTTASNNFSDGKMGQKNNETYKNLYDNNNNLEYLSSTWELNLNYNYSLSKPTAIDEIKYSTLGLQLNLMLTKNWRFSLNGNYDLVNKQLAAPSISIYRDLHCWEMNFAWNPMGAYRYYRFEIKVKAPQLQDLKLTRTRYPQSEW